MFDSLKNSTKLIFHSLKIKGKGDDLLESKSMQIILNLLASERGLAIKIAQVLGSRDINADALRGVTVGHHLIAIPRTEILEIIEKSLASNWQDLFDKIEEAKWVASLGQVHPCKLKGKNGDYVIKVQYPGIHEKIQEQLKLLGLFGLVGGKTKLRKWGFDIEDYLMNFEDSLECELDYFQEWQNLKIFKKFNQTRDLLLPEPVDELIRKNILVTSYMPGVSIDEFINNAALHEKRKVGEQFLIFYLQQLLEDGFVQGDTHKGNYYIYNNKIVFLDFGHFLTLTPQEINALHLLLAGISSGKLTNYLGILTQLGFNLDKLKTIEERIPLILDVLFRPFTQNRSFDLSSWDPQNEIEQIIGEEKWWFRSAGNARFFQLLRSFYGPYLIIKDLKVPINWYQCLCEVLVKLKSANLIDEITPETINPNSEYLRIEVFKLNQKTVDLYLPAKAIFNLENLLDDKIKKSIEAKGIDLKQITTKALKSNLAPMPLFELAEENKFYKVYLA